MSHLIDYHECSDNDSLPRPESPLDWEKLKLNDNTRELTATPISINYNHLVFPKPMENKFKLPKWNINKEHAVYALIGPRNSGKSIMSRYLYLTNPTEELFVVSAISEATEEYKDLTENIYNQTGYLDLILNHCKSNPKTSRTIIVDGTTKDLNKSLSFKDLIMNGRHRRVTLILEAQYALNYSPEIFANVDTAILFADRSSAGLRRLYDRVGGAFETEAIFKRIMKQTCRDFNTLVIDLYSGEPMPYFGFRAPLETTDSLPIKCPKINLSGHNYIKVPIKELQAMTSQLKQLKSSCSQLLDRLKALGISEN